jgi:putative oxidoreductase
MSTLSGIEKWTNEHHPIWIDLLRILLGILLVAKGASLVSHREQLGWLIFNHHVGFIIVAASLYIILIYLGGGLLIAAGLITRWSAGLIIPALLSALYFVDIPGHLSGLNTDTSLSIITLVLSVFFLIYGSGNFSIDYYLKTHTDS